MPEVRRLLIDAHAHLGTSKITGTRTTESALIQTMDRNDIEVSIVQPFPYPTEPVKKVHDAIAELSRRYPGRIYGMASISPHCHPDSYYEEAERCVKDLGFVGIKLHPQGHLAPILSAAADIVFESAAALGVPVMIHTGSGVPFTLPALAIPRARKYPTLSIILAHAGESLFAEEALVAAMECPNIFLETSWSQPGWIRKFIVTLGSHRVMMGADLADNVQSELAKYVSIDISDEDRCIATQVTAREVFGVDRVAGERSETQ